MELPSMPVLPPLAFSRPELLFLLGILPLIWVWQRRAFRSFFSFLALFLHSFVLIALILAVAGLHTLRPGTSSRPLLVLDVSQSMDTTQRQWMHDLITQQLRPEPDDSTIVFAGSAEQLPWTEAQALIFSSSDTLHPHHTNLERALASLLDQSQQRQVYLLSDGWETQGEARALLPLLANRQLQFYPFLPPPAGLEPNVGIQRLGAPQSTNGGETVEVSIAVENTATAPVQGQLSLRRNDQVVWQEAVDLAPGVSLFTHPVQLSDSGLIPLHATFTPTAGDADAQPQDDRATTWVNVAPTDKVLLLSAKARDRRYLAQALKNRGLDVTTIDIEGKPIKIPAPDGFGTVILNNVAKDKLPPALLQRLDAYVKNGGGLIMVGGEESLGLGRYTGTPVERILPVSLVPPQKEERRTAMVLIIDKSGSMRRNKKLLYAKAGTRAVARNLKDSDLFGIIGFDQEPFVVAPLDYLGKSRQRIDDQIDRLKAAGGTMLYPALLEAKRQLERQYATRKHLVILTDGETGGSGSDYLDLVTVMRNELKITVSTIAVGKRPNLRLLARLADYGGGAFHHTVDPSTLPDLFLDEMETATEEKTMVEKPLTPIPNTSSPLLKDLANRRLPPIKGYVEAKVKKGARLDMSLRDDGKRPPLLASWSYGQGKAVAFTSDANGRWSAPWVGWNGFGKFWSQAVRWTLPEAKQKQNTFSVELGHDERGLLIDLFSYAAKEKGQSASATIRDPQDKVVSLPLERLAPGHYQGVYAAHHAGDYQLDVSLPSGEKLGPLGYTLPPPRPREVPQPQPNVALLEALAQATGGSLNPDMATLSLPTSPPEPRSLLPYLIPLALGLYFLELLVRRLA